MQSVNKYIDKDYRMNENCQCQESKHWESGGEAGKIFTEVVAFELGFER